MSSLFKCKKIECVDCAFRLKENLCNALQTEPLDYCPFHKTFMEELNELYRCYLRMKIQFKSFNNYLDFLNEKSKSSYYNKYKESK